MRVPLLLLALVAFTPLAGAAGGPQLPDLPLSSDIVARIEDPAVTLPGRAGPVLPALPLPAPTGASADVGLDGDGVDLSGEASVLLAQDLAAARSLDDAYRAYEAFGGRMGFMPVAPPSTPNQFSENSTITYTHDVGDVNRDGVRDLALDVYCTASQGCPDFALRYGGTPPGSPVPVTASPVTLSNACQRPHILLTVSGRDGSELRNMSLDAPHPAFSYGGTYGGCSLAWVVGTVPLGDGTAGVLTYHIGFVQAYLGFQRLDIQHAISLLDLKTGEPLWTFREDGVLLQPTVATLNIPCMRSIGSDVFLVPLLQQAAPRGVDVVPRATAGTLDIQGVGWNYTMCNTWTQDGVVLRRPAILVNDYDPDEWMARLDPTSGTQLWRVDTFLPGEAEHSVVPRFLFRTALTGVHGVNLERGALNTYPHEGPFTGNQVGNRHDHYWNQRGCCYDLTGDGVNDLVATTLEWSDTPSSNLDALYGLRARMVVFDGADGHRVSQTVLVEAAPAQVVATRIEPLGDTDGDGDAEVAAHIVTLLPYYRHIVSVRGADGAEAWRIDNPRDLELLVVGDADLDGGNDVLVVEWVGWEGYFTFGNPLRTPFTNVTHLPLKVFSGADGALVWKREHFGAVIDTITILANFRANGVPDLDGDGVADILTDDPTILPDRTVLHRLAFISPRTDKAVARIVSAGALAVPAMTGDSDGDGRDDLLLLNGDINDLWLTLHDPDGTPQWSRRVAATRFSGYASAVPTLRTHDIDAVGRPGEDILVNFQMVTQTVGSFILTTSWPQQLAGLRGGNGTLVWALPGYYDANLTEATRGASPASALFANALARQEEGPNARLASVAGLAAPGLLLAAAAAMAGFLSVRRLRL